MIPLYYQTARAPGLSERFRLACGLAGLFLSTFIGCNAEPSADVPVSTKAPSRQQPAAQPADRKTPALSTQQVNDIRRTIQEAGGSLQCDADGQPVGIDLISGRSSADAETMEAARLCRSLKSLKIRAEQIANEELAKLAELPTLEELMIQDAAIDDRVLSEMVASLPQLTRLTLRNTRQVTDGGIELLATASQLRQLALIDLQITGKSFAELATLPSLTSLDLRMCNQIPADALTALRQSASLKELKLAGNGVDDATMTIVASLPHLQSLTVEDASISAEGISRLTNTKELAKQLQTLAFARCARLDDEALIQLNACNRLQRLTVRDVPVMGTFLSQLPVKAILTSLSLNQTYLTGDAFQAISQFTKLKRLEVAQNVLTAEAMQQIGVLTELEYLNLSDCGVSNEWLSCLKDLSHLKTLIIDGNPDVNDATVQSLLESTSLSMGDRDESTQSQ